MLKKQVCQAVCQGQYYKCMRAHAHTDTQYLRVCMCVNMYVCTYIMCMRMSIFRQCIHALFVPSLSLWL